MDPTKVETADDIVAAADARAAQLENPTEPATSPEQPETPAGDLPAGPEGDGEPEAPAAGPDDEGAPTTPDSEPQLTTAELRELRTLAAKGKQADKDKATLRFLLENPDQFERLQRESGVAPRAKETPKPEAQAPSGPDPVRDANGWKYARFEAYVTYLRSKGQTADPSAIQNQVEIDFYQARAERALEMVEEDRKSRETERSENEQKQREWQQQNEARAIGRQLIPLFKKYPQAATPEGQRDVEDAIVASVHRGESLDYEKIVKRVHERGARAVADWTQKKRALAGGTAAASARGGSPQGSRQKLADRLPADISSISEYAERASRGEV